MDRMGDLFNPGYLTSQNQPQQPVAAPAQPASKPGMSRKQRILFMLADFLRGFGAGYQGQAPPMPISVMRRQMESQDELRESQARAAEARALAQTERSQREREILGYEQRLKEAQAGLEEARAGKTRLETELLPEKEATANALKRAQAGYYDIRGDYLAQQPELQRLQLAAKIARDKWQEVAAKGNLASREASRKDIKAYRDELVKNTATAIEDLGVFRAQGNVYRSVAAENTIDLMMQDLAEDAAGGWFVSTEEQAAAKATIQRLQRLREQMNTGAAPGGGPTPKVGKRPKVRINPDGSVEIE